MALEKSEAVVLKAFNWSESSRTVVFFSEQFGRIALVDKGGRRLATKRGRLIPFSRLEISFYRTEKETRGYLSETEVLKSYGLEREGMLGRLAYGSAANELLNLLLPEEEPQRQLYHYLISYLDMMEVADRRALPSLFLAFYLRVLSQLGYHPCLGYCVSCGKKAESFAEEARWQFGVDQGGIVCEACQKPGEYYIGLTDDGHKVLVGLQKASLKEAATVPLRYSLSGQLTHVLTRFVASQTGVKSELKSLEFIEKLKNGESIGQ